MQPDRLWLSRPVAGAVQRVPVRFRECDGVGRSYRAPTLHGLLENDRGVQDCGRPQKFPTSHRSRRSEVEPDRVQTRERVAVERLSDNIRATPPIWLWQWLTCGVTEVAD